VELAGIGCLRQPLVLEGKDLLLAAEHVDLVATGKERENRVLFEQGIGKLFLFGSEGGVEAIFPRAQMAQGCAESRRQGFDL